MLQSMGLQRTGHNLVTEQQQQLGMNTTLMNLPDNHVIY